MNDTAFGARPERAIVKRSVEGFTNDVLKHFDGDADAYEGAVRQVHGMIDNIRKEMLEHTLAWKLKMPHWRRVGLVPGDKFDQWAMAAMPEPKPAWLTRYISEANAKGVTDPLAQAWRVADNRLRGYFAATPGGMSKMLDSIYDGRVGRAAHEVGRAGTVGYHIFRFITDLRWLALEAVEAPTLTLFREGPGAAWEGMGRGKNAGELPLFMGKDQGEAMRSAWAWWLAQSDPGGTIRGRERYILAMVRRTQHQEFPKLLRQVAADSPDLMGAIRAFDAGDPMAWAKRLDTDWELATKRSQDISPKDAARLFKPWMDEGTISKMEYDELVKAHRYTGHPAIDAELSKMADPRMQPLLNRLAAINEQGWNDAAGLIFGAVDRSNIQRLANHPLLYWPISYQIKATKWLAGLLFDRAFGVDTGSAGAVTLGMIHQQHKDRMVNDPEYATTVSQNPTLLFVAQMMFPIAPWDLGVALSPFTRLAISTAVYPEDEGYRRNVFSVGPGYTYYSLLPRLFYEQSKRDSWAQETGGIVGTVFRAGQRYAPYSVPVKPTTSELGYTERQVGHGGTPGPFVGP